jgi:hypothetical protein
MPRQRKKEKFASGKPALGLPKETLPSLLRRQESCTIIGYERILKYVTHPCNKFVSLVKTNQYDLRTGRIRIYIVFGGIRIFEV